MFLVFSDVETEIKSKLEFVFLQKQRCLPTFQCHIVLYIQRTIILTNEIPREITQKV